MNRAIVVVAAVVAILLSVFGLGLLMNWLGNWTDRYPEHMTLVWTIWNLLMVATAGILIWQWRRYLRSHENTPPSSGRA